MLLLSILLCFRDVDTEEFDDLTTRGNGTIPYFVMFYGNHCPACHAALPAFCEAEEKVYDMADFLTVDIHKNPELAQSFGIMSIPSFGLFFNGEIGPFRGRRDAPSMTSFIAECVSYTISHVNESWANHDFDQVILFSKRRVPPALLAAGYGMFYRYGISFGMCNDEKIARTIEPNASFTSFYFYKKGGESKNFTTFQQVYPFQNAISEFFGIPIERRPPHDSTNNICALPKCNHEHHEHHDEL